MHFYITVTFISANTLMAIHCDLFYKKKNTLRSFCFSLSIVVVFNNDPQYFVFNGEFLGSSVGLSHEQFLWTKKRHFCLTRILTNFCSKIIFGRDVGKNCVQKLYLAEMATNLMCKTRTLKW